MAEFAIHSIAQMAQQNPLHATFQGNLTQLGQSLNPHWQLAIPVLGVIIAAHFLLFAAAVYGSRSAIIKDDSMLAIARLLRPLVDALGDTGTVMNGKDISTQIAKHRDFDRGVVYGPKALSAPGQYTQGLAKDVQPIDQWPRGRHPDGTYR